MRILTVPAVLTALSLATLTTPAARAAGNADLEKCYQAFGQLEETQANGKKVTVYKEPAAVAAECNQKVVQRAKGAKKVADIVAYAEIIGKNSNWQSAMPIYTLAAKADAQKASCSGKDQLYALDLALAAPADDPVAKGGVDFMEACWPAAKDTFIGMVRGSSGYTKKNLCTFLKAKKGLPADKQARCA